MELCVDLVTTPRKHEDTVLVVDTVRATTSAALYLERGAKALYLVDELEDAYALKGKQNLLAGERGGVKPPGFDLGNSPLEALEQQFEQQILIMSTTNGTRAARIACEGGKHVLLACLRNAHASARKARECAHEMITILCAGTDNHAGLDDIYTAGVLVEYLLALGEWTLNDGARIALTVRRQYADPLEPLRQARSAELLSAIGLEADLPYCAEVSVSATVPTYSGRQGKAFVFEP